MSGPNDAVVLEVAITPGSTPGSVKVDVLHSPAGETSAEVELPASALMARRAEVQTALLAPSVLAQRPPETERPVREVGQALFAALAGSANVAGRYRSSVDLAAFQEKSLRVSLRIDSPELAGLPWETMYDEADGTYVCLQHGLTRYVPVSRVPAPLTVQPPLRILGVISAPRHGDLAELDVTRERGLLNGALAGLAAEGLAEVTWAPAATWDALHELLLSETWHVLHFIGHGGFDHRANEGFVVLTTADGKPDPVEASRFSSLLRRARPVPRLIVLNSCSGAATGSTDLFAGTAAALTRAGVPAVAAMQFTITDDSAIAFARGFYTAIAEGRGVDDAVSTGRVTILGTGNGTLEWLTPVLYLRGSQTQLFTRAADVPAGKGNVPSFAKDGQPVPEAAASQQGPWLLLVNQLMSRLDLDNWDDNVGGLLRSSAGMPSSSKARLLSLTIWLNGRVLPDGEPELKHILLTLQRVTADLLSTFDLYCEAANPEQEDPWLRTAKFYKLGDWRQRSSEADLWEAHINLLSDLALELTRAVNWLCDFVRREFDPLFRSDEGALQLNGGPYSDADDKWFRPEYSPDEIARPDGPYESLEDFKTRRFTRDFHTLK
jgi:CHAT domain